MKSVSLLRKIGRLVFLFLLMALICWIASRYMTRDTILWYEALPHSSLNPPAVVFSLVWSVLLFCQAIAAFLVWDKADLLSFTIQLVLNMCWSFVFFYLRNPALALVVLLLFLIALMVNIKDFAIVHRTAGWLMVPTLLWSFFALYLNAVIVF